MLHSLSNGLAADRRIATFPLSDENKHVGVDVHESAFRRLGAPEGKAAAPNTTGRDKMMSSFGTHLTSCPEMV